MSYSSSPVVKYTLTWNNGGYVHTLDTGSRGTMVMTAEALSVDQPVMVINNATQATARFKDGSLQWTDANF